MSILTTVRRVAKGGLQAELQDTVERPGRINVLAKLNKGDERFNVGTPRRAWFPVTIESLIDLGVSKEIVAKIDAAKEEGSITEVQLVDPKIEGEVLRVQVVESIVPDEYQKSNTMTTAKQIMIDESIAGSKIKTEYPLKTHVGKNGYFLDDKGHFIFSKTTVTVDSQINHNFIEGSLVPETELANFGAVLASTSLKQLV